MDHGPGSLSDSVFGLSMRHVQVGFLAAQPGDYSALCLTVEGGQGAKSPPFPRPGNLGLLAPCTSDHEFMPIKTPPIVMQRGEGVARIPKHPRA